MLHGKFWSVSFKFYTRWIFLWITWKLFLFSVFLKDNFFNSYHSYHPSSLIFHSSPSYASCLSKIKWWKEIFLFSREPQFEVQTQTNKICFIHLDLLNIFSLHLTLGYVHKPHSEEEDFLPLDVHKIMCFRV